MNQNLKDKKIRVGQNTYIVENQNVNLGTNREVLILTRELSPAQEEIKTIFDLGYSSEDDINYPNDAIADTYKMIEASTGHEIEIASIDPTERIIIKNVVLMGLSISDTSMYKVEIQENDQKHIIGIDLKFLAKAILLADEFRVATDDYKKREKTESAEYKKIIDEAADEVDQEKIDDAMKDIFKNMDRMFKSDAFKNMSSGRNQAPDLSKMGLDGDLKEVIDSIFGKGFNGGR